MQNVAEVKLKLQKIESQIQSRVASQQAGVVEGEYLVVPFLKS